MSTGIFEFPRNLNKYDGCTCNLHHHGLLQNYAKEKSEL